MLGSKARQLLHAIKILEGVGESHAAVCIHHLLHGDLFSCLVTDGGNIVGVDLVPGLILLNVSVRLSPFTDSESRKRKINVLSCPQRKNLIFSCPQRHVRKE